MAWFAGVASISFIAYGVIALHQHQLDVAMFCLSCWWLTGLLDTQS